MAAAARTARAHGDNAVQVAVAKPPPLDRKKLAAKLPTAAFGGCGLLLPPQSVIEVDFDGVAHRGVVQPYDERWCRGDFPVKIGDATHMLTYPRADIRVYYVPGINVIPIQ